ncbi:unnamed protein product [Ectocarpus sp. CCAP 1310/34]|nr:unnamed protein product [Ectocarpus sp. CCAP 1310/34]
MKVRLVDGNKVKVYETHVGQVAYTGLLQMFPTPRSVCVLVEKYDHAEEDCRKLEELLASVCNWLRSISRSVPHNEVILVATKCDLAGGNAGEIGLRMEHACRVWLSSWIRHGMQPVQVETGVSFTSCCVTAGVDENGETDDNPSPSLLDRLVHKSDRRGLRGAQMGLPRSWDVALTVVEALEHGR